MTSAILAIARCIGFALPQEKSCRSARRTGADQSSAFSIGTIKFGYRGVREAPSC